MRKAFVIVFSLAFLIFFSILYYGLFYSSDPREIPSALINRQAPDFKLVGFADNPVELEQFRGKPIILNFWASWCVTCQDESRILEAIHQEYQGRGAQVIGIAINDTKEDAKRFAEKFGKTYLLALDKENAEIALNYGIVGAPETFLIDKDGVIRDKILGLVELSSLKNFLDNQLQ